MSETTSRTVFHFDQLYAHTAPFSAIFGNTKYKIMRQSLLQGQSNSPGNRDKALWPNLLYK